MKVLIEIIIIGFIIGSILAGIFGFFIGKNPNIINGSSVLFITFIAIISSGFILMGIASFDR